MNEDENSHGRGVERRVEIDVLIPTTFDSAQTDRARRVVFVFQKMVEARYPEFIWKVSLYRREESVFDAMGALEAAVLALQKRGADFVFSFSDERLISPKRRPLTGAISSPLKVAVLDLERLANVGEESETEERILAHRLLFALWSLNGIGRDEWRSAGNSVGPRLGKLAHRELISQLESVADARLEERPEGNDSRLSFALRALVTARRELLQMILRGRPWSFPLRVPKLMAGAGSATTVVLLTAEAWQLGASQSWPKICGLSLMVWLGTVTFLLGREEITAHRAVRPSEQRVVARAAIIVGVACGMLLTFALAAICSWVLGRVLYPPAMLSSWTGRTFEPALLVKVALFVATLGLGVGALGVSLDAPSFFKYAVVVTCELTRADDAMSSPPSIVPGGTSSSATPSRGRPL